MKIREIHCIDLDTPTIEEVIQAWTTLHPTPPPDWIIGNIRHIIHSGNWHWHNILLTLEQDGFTTSVQITRRKEKSQAEILVTNVVSITRELDQ